ncbi:MAG: beta-ketoacyl synthase chain length factor [Chromatiaceae bacterium]
MATEAGSSLRARIAGVAVVGPGMDDWAGAQSLLIVGTQAPLPLTRIAAPDGLPPAERRRVGSVVKLALSAGLAACREAGVDPADPGTVFASSGGDGDNCHAICEGLAGSDRLISPIRFHNSVSNAASGYWGIATGSRACSSVLSAYDGSFAGGLIEAFALLATDKRPVLLIAYDHPYPSPLAETRPLGPPFAVALLLDRSDAESGPRLTLGAIGMEPATTLDDAPLEALRRSVPAARSIPLLSRLARGTAGRVALDYLDGLTLEIELEP